MSDPLHMDVAPQCRAILARYIGVEAASIYKPLGVAEQLAQLVDAYKEQLRVSEYMRKNGN